MLYVLCMKVTRPVCLAAHHDNEAWHWHDWYGHLHFDTLQGISCKNMVRGLPQIDHIEQLCDSYVRTKLKRLPFPCQAVFRVQNQLKLVHGDLCGPVTLATPGGRRFFLLLVDDASRFMWVVLLPTKAATADAIKHIQAAVENECSCKLWVLCTDNGGEYTTTEFAAYCTDEGIQRHYSTSYSP